MGLLIAFSLGAIVCLALVAIDGRVVNPTKELPQHAYKVAGGVDAAGVNEYEALTKYLQALLKGHKGVNKFKVAMIDPETREPLEDASPLVVSMHPEGCVGWSIIDSDGEVLEVDGQKIFTNFLQVIQGCPQGHWVRPVVQE